MERTFSGVNVSPARMSATTNRERRKARLACSLGVGEKSGSPRAAQASRAACAMAANASGVSEKALSGPGWSCERVKCFSMQQAPKAVAATGTVIPSVWSDSPAGQAKARESSGMAERRISSGGAG